MFTFNGIASTTYLIENGVNRSVLPTIKPRTVSVPRRAGVYDSGIDLGAMEITVDVTVTSTDLENFRSRIRSIAAWLFNENLCPLTFSDEPTLTYYARVSGDTDLEQISNTGQGTIKFLCPEPFAYGATKTDVVKAADAIFTRASTAYKKDGTLVASGVPRFESGGLTVEVNCTNYIPVDQSRFISGWSATPHANISFANNVDGEEKGRGTVNIAFGVGVYGNVFTYALNSSYAGATYTASIEELVISGLTSGFFTLELEDYNGTTYASTPSTQMSANGTYSPSVTRVFRTPITSGTVYLRANGVNAGATVTVKRVQFENRNYKSSWQIGGTPRVGEVVEIPATLNNAEGSIETIITIPANGRWTTITLNAVVFWACAVDGNVGNRMWADILNSKLRFHIYDSSNAAKTITCTNSLTAGTYRCGFKYDSAGNLAIFLGGVKQAVTTVSTGSGIISAPIIKACIGGTDVSGYQLSGQIGLMHISNIARPDADFANGLSITNNSTYYSTYSNLSAQDLPLTNSGTVKSYAVVTVKFLASASFYKIVKGGYILKVNKNFVKGDILVIDCKKNVVTLNGARVMDCLDITSDFFPVEIGANSYVYEPSAVGTVTVYYTEKWL